MSRYEQPYTGAFYSTNPPAPPTPQDQKRRSGLGAAALVLGLLAMLFGWIPVLGLVMIPPALLAVLLGILGFVVAVVTGRTGKALPFIGTVVAAFALLIPPAATALFALSVTPWAYTVGMDQVQIELEYDLKKQGVATDQAERVAEQIGDTLRSFAHPRQWRDGIAALHRFERICEDYRRELVRLEEDDYTGRGAAAQRFRDEIARLAEIHGAQLSDEDLDLLADVFGRQQIRSADDQRHWQRQVSTGGYRLRVDGYAESLAEECESCCEE